ncbi:MAG: hypothetical protein ACRC5T_08170, partial [Cetobacterium sp.]
MYNSISGTIMEPVDVGDANDEGIEERTKQLKLVAATIEKFVQSVARNYKEVNGEDMPAKEQEKIRKSGMMSFTNSKEVNLNKERLLSEYEKKEIELKAATIESETALLQLYTSTFNNAKARVDQDNDKTVKEGISTAPEMQTRLKSEKWQGLISPKMKNMKTFLDDLEKIDKTAFKNMSIEKADELYRRWSNAVALNTATLNNNLKILNNGNMSSQTLVENILTPDVEKTMEPDKVAALRAIQNDTSTEDGAEEARMAAMIKIFSQDISEATRALIFKTMSSLGETYTKETRKNLIEQDIDNQIQAEAERNIKEQDKKDNIVIRGTKAIRNVVDGGKSKDERLEAEKTRLKNDENTMNNARNKAEVNVPNMNNREFIKLPDIVKHGTEEGNKTNESIEKYYNKIHQDLLATAESFDKFAIKSNFVDRTKLAQDKLN